MQTSLYLQQSNSDFKVVVCAPCIEYHISARNFTFVKTLTRQEISSLVERQFANWDHECLRIVTSVKKFQEVNLVAAIPRQEEPAKFYFFSETSGKLSEASSAQDFKK